MAVAWACGGSRHAAKGGSDAGGIGGLAAGGTAAGPTGGTGAAATGGAAGADLDASVPDSSAAGNGGSAGHGGATTVGGTAGSSAGGSAGQTAQAGAAGSGAGCETDRACGVACCEAGQVCSFGACRNPGASCAASSDCASGEFCDFSLGMIGVGGDCGVLPSGRCLPSPPQCAATQPPDATLPGCTGACEVLPSSSPWAVELEAAWGGKLAPPYDTDVMMTPVVAQLDDDDCDGKITARDIPDIVFSTFSGGAYNGAGVLHAITVRGGEKWALPDVIHPTKQLAVGNIDGQPGNEIVGCGSDGAVHEVTAQGAPGWASAPMTCVIPAIADLDGDGTVEVVVEDGILDGATGSLEHPFSTPLSGSFVVSDIDGDGQLDIVTATQGFHSDGVLFVDTNQTVSNFGAGTADWKSAWVGVADLDRSGTPEVVVVDDGNHALSVWHFDASQTGKFSIVRSPIDVNGGIASSCAVGAWGETHGGGPPAIGDLTGDGIPDVGVASGSFYVAFDGAKLVDPAVAGAGTILWQVPVTDCSSASTGSTIFDFDARGHGDVVYSDQQRLRIYDGSTGNVLFATCNTTATVLDGPVVADVDGDGHADIVAASNAYARGSASFQCNGEVQAGIRIFGEVNGAFARTRSVWNEHGYHVTNVDDDGSIPAHEAHNYEVAGLDNFRENALPGAEFDASDAIVSAPRCTDGFVEATIRNVGSAPLPVDTSVGFYSGTPPNGTFLGSAATSVALYPAEAVNVRVPLNAPLDGTAYAVVDPDDLLPATRRECRTSNNTSAVASMVCAPL